MRVKELASNAQEGQRREEVLAEVVTLHDATLNDLPAQLRNLADRIEAGEVGSLIEEWVR